MIIREILDTQIESHIFFNAGDLLSGTITCVCILNKYHVFNNIFNNINKVQTQTATPTLNTDIVDRL